MSESPEERRRRQQANVGMAHEHFGPLNRYGLSKELRPILARLAALEARLKSLEAAS